MGLKTAVESEYLAQMAVLHTFTNASMRGKCPKRAHLSVAVKADALSEPR